MFDSLVGKYGRLDEACQPAAFLIGSLVSLSVGMLCVAVTESLADDDTVAALIFVVTKRMSKSKPVLSRRVVLAWLLRSVAASKGLLSKLKLVSVVSVCFLVLVCSSLPGLCRPSIVYSARVMTDPSACTTLCAVVSRPLP